MDATHTQQRAWTEQLYREYRNIVYQYGAPLRPLTLRIEPLGSQWGQFDASRREIRLSERLIRAYPWDVVLEVLKHEMAHQLVHDAGLGGRPHGAEFAAACAQLGVASWARCASGELPKQRLGFTQSVDPARARLLSRAEKLLRLATSSNEHEAASAMARVRELYARHNLEETARSAAPDMVHHVVCHKRKRMERPETLIFSLLVEHFFVRCVHMSQYDAEDACTYRAVEVMGRPENVAMAIYVHGFLCQQLQALWQRHRVANQVPAGQRVSFMLGVLCGFSAKLRSTELPAHASAHERALVLRGSAALDDFVQRRHPRVSDTAPRGTRAVAEAYAEGRKAGAGITLHKPVEDGSATRGLLLR